MNIWIVLAVAVVFGGLALPARESVDVGRRLVGRHLRAAPIRIQRADPVVRRHALHGDHHDRDPRVRDIERGAPRGSLAPARPVHDGEEVRDAPRRHGRRTSGARGRERLHADERAARAAVLRAHGASRVAVGRSPCTTRRSISTPARIRSCALETANPGRVPEARRERQARLLPQLRLLSRRRSVGQRHVRARAGSDPHQLRRPGHDRAASRHVPVLARLEGRSGAAGRRRSLGLGHAGLGEDPEGRGDVGSDPLPLRLHRPAAARRRRRGTNEGADPRRPLRRAGDRRSRYRCRRASRRRTSAPRRSVRRARRSTSKHCAQCHGDKGDGEGYATPHLFPKPRNFTSGKFKVRTTPNGALPTHQDLVNIIRRGMPYTSMPAWPNLSDQDVSNLAYYIKSFSPDFADAGRTSEAGRTPERACQLRSNDRAREEALRRDGLRQVSRHVRARRRIVGAHAEG